MNFLLSPMAAIFLVVLTDIIGFGMIIPILPELVKSLNLAGFGYSLIVSTYPIAQFIAAPLLGRLSDRIGRRPVLVVSKLGTVVAYIIFALANNLPLLLLSRLIDGATGGNISAARAYISDITTPKTRAKGMAVIGISFGLGFIIGPALGGILYNLGGSHTLPALAGALLSLISALMAWFFIKEDKLPTPAATSSSFVAGFFKFLTRPLVNRIFLAQFIFMIVMAGWQTTLTFFSSESFGFTPQQNSMLFVYLGILGIIIQTLIARFTFKNSRTANLLGLVFCALGVVVTALTLNPLGLYFGLAINSLGNALINIYLPTLLSTLSSTDPEGELQGVLEGVSSLARVIGPILVGLFISTYPRQIYLFLAFILVFAFYSLTEKSQA